jgi:FtsP/CotA-like multicopper oxidase with cupredoxin domain
MHFSRRNFLQVAGAGIIGGRFLRPAFAADDAVELVAAPVLHDVAGRGMPNALVGYDAQIPGPVLRFRQGSLARVRFTNKMDEPTTVHWHGIRLANAMDGVPGLTQKPVQPGETFDYSFVPPDAGTFWFHAHVDSWSQVARGLFGALIIEEVTPVFDVSHDHVLVLTDWRLDDRGGFDVASLGSAMDWSHAGRIGTVVTVNGQIAPELPLAETGVHRLRLINTSTARVLKINLPGAVVLALDGQAISRQFSLDPYWVLGPAQRVDLAVASSGLVSMTEVSSVPCELVRFAGSAESGTDRVPALLRPAIPSPDLDNAFAVPFAMQGGAFGSLNGVAIPEMHGGMQAQMPVGPLWAFNNVSGMGVDPLFEAGAGTTVRIDMANETQWDHAIHVHGHHFQTVLRNGIATDDDAWLDTVMIAPTERLSIAFVADNPGAWMIHCHMLEHSVSGMDTWFRVS